ncbi:MAG TPA: electron transfer flavoprotein subunit alpha/FixB family protein [Anaeromyxobacteraceae bacterium]|nr:electron transfer flavoprotein subunit alpha/FixB family protein [Anaeromyxobacteraceae bacterium]
MTNVLVVAEHVEGRIRKSTLNVLAAGQEVARRVGGQVRVAVLGRGAALAAHELAAYGEGVLLADAPGLEHYLAEAYAPVVARLAKEAGAAWVAGAATAFGKDLLPRVAALLDAACATDVLAFGGEGAAVTFRRPMWAGNVVAEVELATATRCFTVRPTEFPAAEKRAGGAVTPVEATVDVAALRTRFLSFREVKSERPELTEARVVVAGGRGTKGDFKVIEQLADALGGAVGASRAAVDSGWAPNDWQVGQTGKIVAPELYVAAGISGAMQHVAGMKSAKVIVAINKDPEAPIFQVADYGLVADLFQAIPALARMAQGGK